MITLDQSPTDPTFVQNPYPFYDRARAGGPLFHWTDYNMVCATDYSTVNAIFKDKRFGREPIGGWDFPDRLKPFYDFESHSMLELEPPRHTRLRGLVLRAFTSRRINALGPEIEALCHDLITQFPNTPFDLIPAYANQVPVIVIARLLGVPEAMADQLLEWSNAMVRMYMAGRTHKDEDAAVAATIAFSDFMRTYINQRRATPADDLITHLIAAEQDGDRLTTDELISTCVLLLNAGHEATVHTLGNGIKTLIQNNITVNPDNLETVTEEILRYDPPLHMFTRFVYEDVTIAGHSFKRGNEVGLMLAAANRDPERWDQADQFIPTRPIQKNTAFGAGIHFCVGAPLARLEMMIALRVLYERCPTLILEQPPQYGDVYHFHGLERLIVREQSASCLSI